MATALLKLTDVQLGTSVTATNNFTWYQPSSPDGTIRLGNGNSGSATDILTITSAGNVGIGTSSPASTLHTIGTITVGQPGTYGYSQFITTNSTGNSYIGNYTSAGTRTSYVNYFDGSNLFAAWTDGAYPMIIGTNNNERMRIDSSGNVSIGTTSSVGARFCVQQATSDATVGALYKGYTTSATDGQRTFKILYTDASGNYYANCESRATLFQFYINSAEQMRLNTNGNLLLGTTTEAANETRLVLSTNSGTTRWSVGPWSSVSNNFYITATSASQGVYLSGTTATSWSALSDERWKTELQPIENAAEKVSTLRAVTGVYTNDADKKRKPFLIAQDVLAVLPEAVDTEDPEKYGLAYTEVIPLLVAAIKELTARVEQLEAN